MINDLLSIVAITIIVIATICIIFMNFHSWTLVICAMMLQPTKLSNISILSSQKDNAEGNSQLDVSSVTVVLMWILAVLRYTFYAL